jgi:hypothetical protein
LEEVEVEVWVELVEEVEVEVGRTERAGPQPHPQRMRKPPRVEQGITNERTLAVAHVS